MKTHRLLLVAALWSVIVFFCAASASAQNYQIDWFTLDGGGGASAGGQYTLTGTIGQPDAGELAGGSYVLEGGFWPGIVPQSGAPRLQESSDPAHGVLGSRGRTADWHDRRLWRRR